MELAMCPEAQMPRAVWVTQVGQDSKLMVFLAIRHQKFSGPKQLLQVS